jgi:hypothetical protein
VVGSGLFQVGGYAAITVSHAERPEETERPEVSELIAALMAWGQISPRASYLVELDMAKRTTETWTGRESDQWLLPVRMYVEYAASDLLRLRVGRFLTPIGQWNEHHAEPLTWTPTRPLTTYHPFAKSLTGLLAAGERPVAGRDVGYALFWSPRGSPGGGLDAAEESAFIDAAGGRVAVEIRPGLTLGLSGARIRRSRPVDPEDPDHLDSHAEEDEGPEHDEREEDASERALLGADVRWERRGFEVAVEGNWLPASEHGASEGGAFALAAVHVRGPWWAVGRAESYRLPDSSTANVGFAGLALRASPRFVAKLGWQFTENPSSRIPDGWFVSLSSLF